MNNVFGYIDEQSEASFRERPVCEVDALVFAWLSYFEIEKLDDRGIACIDLTLDELAGEAGTWRSMPHRNAEATLFR